ncbi:MAG: substrate-binding domain-containing protein [Isosphaeraceae bacterium]
MRRVLSWMLALGFLGVAGCSNDAFTPPPPPELSEVPSSISATSPTATTPSITLIMAGEAHPDQATWELAGRQEAGRRKVILVIEKLDPKAPPSEQANRIREVARNSGTSALIVEPADDPSVAAALNDVSAAGKPVVLLERAVPPRDPRTRFGLVRYEPFEPVARQAAEKLHEEAKLYGIPNDAHVLLTKNTRYGPWFQPRLDLLERLLKQAGFAGVVVVPFDGEDEAAQKALMAALDSDPKAAAILASEDVGMTAALAVHDKLKDKKTTYVGGFMTVDRTMNGGYLTRATVTVDRNVPSFIIGAIQVAAGLARGEPVDLESTVPNPVHLRTAGPSGANFPRPR